MSLGEGGAIAADTAEPDKAGHNGRNVTINDRSFEVYDPVANGRQLLTEGGFDPASDHVLIQLLKRGSRSVGLDESVDLRGQGPYVFRAFESDRVFNFTLDERGYEWGASSIPETELRDIGSVPEDRVIVLERKNKPDLELGDGDVVQLGDSGTEHLRTRKGLITVLLDGDEKAIARGTYTTEELIQLLGVEQGYVLDVVNDQDQLESLKPGQKIKVRKGMKFISHAPCGGSS